MNKKELNKIAKHLKKHPQRHVTFQTSLGKKGTYKSRVIDAQNRVLQQLINEIIHLRELSVGTLETIKLMPDYQDAIDALKKQMEENVKEKKKAKQNGTIESDTK